MSRKHNLNESEAELIKRAKRGDKTAFGQLVRNFQKPVYSLVWRFVRDHDAADDLTQEAFIRAYQALDSFIEGKSFRNWIFTIASNLAINSLRRRKREQPLDQAIPESLQEDSRPSSNPHNQAVASSLKDKIDQAVEKLPEEFKTVFILRIYEDMSYAEIAETLRIESGTVMSRLSRARAKLREMLKDYLDE
jgi:RNA polymerase sigma-70 factor (ECF subfamily)